MTYKGFIKGSRTLDTAFLIVILGVIQQNLPLVQEHLGDYYGWFTMGIGVLMAYLRKVTTTPLK